MKKRMVRTIPDHVTTTAMRKWGRGTQKGPPGFVHSGVGVLLGFQRMGVRY